MGHPCWWVGETGAGRSFRDGSGQSGMAVSRSSMYNSAWQGQETQQLGMTGAWVCGVAVGDGTWMSCDRVWILS